MCVCVQYVCPHCLQYNNIKYIKYLTFNLRYSFILSSFKYLKSFIHTQISLFRRYIKRASISMIIPHKAAFQIESLRRFLTRQRQCCKKDTFKGFGTKRDEWHLTSRITNTDQFDFHLVYCLFTLFMWLSGIVIDLPVWCVSRQIRYAAHAETFD